MKACVLPLATLLVIFPLSFGQTGDTSADFKTTERELRFVSGDGAIHTYSGLLEVKKKGDQDYALLRDGTTVLEISLHPLIAEAAALRSGLESKITLLNRFPDDSSTPIAWVSKREHFDHLDMLDDEHGTVHTLVRIESNGEQIYDRSFCSVHQVSMELRNVGVAFGLLAFSAAERYCLEHFPNSRDFGLGGCTIPVQDEYKTVQIYICSACVTACKEYTAVHSESPRN